jgi:hypothetical protein
MSYLKQESYLLIRNGDHIRFLPIILLLIFITGCNVTFNKRDDSIIKTQTVMNVQMTTIAMTQNTESENNNPISNQTQIFLDTRATIHALDEARVTEDAAKIGEVQSTETPQPAAATEVVASVTPEKKVNTVDFDTWYKEASILLYEDMAGVFNAKRIVNDAVMGMGLKTVDVKDASGNFLKKIKENAPNGKAWDLIISASEARKAAADDFMPGLIDAVDGGSALIIEHWRLDRIRSSRLTMFFSKCGVQYQQDFASPGGPISPAGQSLYPQDYNNPILSEPNPNLRISLITGYWSDFYKSSGEYIYDYGDLLEKTSPDSKASIALVAKNLDPDKYAALVSCYDGRVVLWTSSTHNYGADRVIPLWQNMIYNALKGRYQYINSH